MAERSAQPVGGNNQVVGGVENANTQDQSTGSRVYYGRRRDLKAEQAAQERIRSQVSKLIQNGNTAPGLADAWKNPAYVNAVAYGGYSPQDTANDMAARAAGTGGVVHPFEPRAAWFAEITKNGIEPPRNMSQAERFAAEAQLEGSVLAEEIVKTFKKETLSAEEFFESERAKEIEEDIRKFIQEETDFEMVDLDKRMSELKEDAETAFSRLLEDKGEFGDDVARQRNRLDEDRAVQIRRLGLQGTRNREDFERQLGDLNRRRGELDEDRLAALERLNINEKQLDLRERDEDEARTVQSNRANVIGSGIGNELQRRLDEEQGLRRREFDLGREDFNRQVGRQQGALGRAEDQLRTGFGRAEQDLGLSREDLDRRFGRGVEDLTLQEERGLRGFGEREQDLTRQDERRRFDLNRAIERLNRQQQQQQDRATGEALTEEFQRAQSVGAGF